MRSAALVLLLSTAGLIGGAAFAQPQSSGGGKTILPGYWESQNKVSFPVNETSTSRQCVTPQKVAQFLSGPASRNYSCTYSRSSARDGVVSAQGECVDKNGLHSSIAVDGTYSPTTFDLKAQIRVNVGGLGIPVNASTKAVRIADDCPADAK